MTSIAVIGLYLAFAIPIWLRWRHGENFEPAAGTTASKYKWMNLIAVAEILIVSVYLMMPFIPGANPFRDDFEFKYMNYSPIVTLGALLILVDLVAGLGEEVVHRAEAQHRPRGRQDVRGVSRQAPPSLLSSLASVGAAGLVQQAVEVRPVELRQRQLVLLHAPRPEVELDRAHLGLDRCPQASSRTSPSGPAAWPVRPCGAGAGRSSCRRGPRAASSDRVDSLQMLPSSKHGSLLPPYS